MPASLPSLSVRQLSRQAWDSSPASSPPPLGEDMHSPRNSEQARRLSHSMSGQMALRGMRRLEARRSMEETHYLKARLAKLNPPVDMRMLDYVAQYDSNLMCPICRCAFVDPVVLTECDHCFCHDCIRQSWTTDSLLGPRGDCPSCRTPAKLRPRSATSKILLNILDELVVKCPKADQGCSAEVKRGEVQDHVSIYCGCAMVECPADDCDLAVMRKDTTGGEGCLHYGVSCADCRENMLKADLETHWKSGCPDRKATCNLCQGEIFDRNYDEHVSTTCPSSTIPCAGASLGCVHRTERGSSPDAHGKTCTLALLAPVLQKQQQRLDEQEVAHKEMLRKLDLFESGFSAIRTILYSRQGSPDPAARSDHDAAPPHRRTDSVGSIAEEPTFAAEPSAFLFSAPPSAQPSSSPTSRTHPHPAPPPPGSPPAEFAFDLSPPAPYASPLHHLLSMHESLRAETARLATALADADARHALQSLNDALHARDDRAYLAAQLAALTRQVHWLTATQLQRSAAPRDAAGARVEAAVEAVSSAATALTGAARVVGVRRGAGEELRTKL